MAMDGRIQYRRLLVSEVEIQIAESIGVAIWGFYDVDDGQEIVL